MLYKTKNEFYCIYYYDIKYYIIQLILNDTVKIGICIYIIIFCKSNIFNIKNCVCLCGYIHIR